MTNKLDWFPLSLAKQKRQQIKEIIQALNNTDPHLNKNAKAIEYVKQRLELMKISRNDGNEYPPWDKVGFDKFVSRNKNKEYDRNELDEENELHLLKLKYYYNPDF